jgi:hypothetical protein
MSAARPDESDAALAARAINGDRSAFSLIVRRHQEPLYRFIRRYVGDADEAYDPSFQRGKHWGVMTRHVRLQLGFAGSLLTNAGTGDAAELSGASSTARERLMTQ